MSAGRTLSAAVIFVVVAACPAAAQPVKREDPVKAERRKLEETHRQLREVQEKAAEARRRETSLLAELEAIERSLQAKRQELRRLDGRARRVQADINALRGDIGTLERRRAGQELVLARRLIAMYKIHVQGAALPVILSDEDPSARLAVLRRLSTLASLDARLIQEYRGTSEKLGERKDREEARRAELGALRADGRREQAEADREAARRRDLLGRVRDEGAYHERMAGELGEAARRLEAFIRELQARQRRLAKVPPPGPTVAPGTPFGELRGRLPWPAAGRVVGVFGPQVHPRFGTRTFRNGVDIEAEDGSAVTAVHAGHVVYTGWFKGYGNLIILDHGGGFYTLYAHIAEFEVAEGDDVRPGQRIGTVGDTGSLEGPRLYFEVRHQGRPEDPQSWLRERG